MGRVEIASASIAEHQVSVLPGFADFAPLSLLAGAVLFQCPDQERREQDLPPAPRRRWLRLDLAIAGNAVNRAAYMQGVIFEVDIAPAQADKRASAHASGDSQQYDDFQAMPSSRFDELLGLLLSKITRLAPPRSCVCKQAPGLLPRCTTLLLTGHHRPAQSGAHPQSVAQWPATPDHQGRVLAG